MASEKAKPSCDTALWCKSRGAVTQYRSLYFLVGLLGHFGSCLEAAYFYTPTQGCYHLIFRSKEFVLSSLVWGCFVKFGNSPCRPMHPVRHGNAATHTYRLQVQLCFRITIYSLGGYTGSRCHCPSLSSCRDQSAISGHVLQSELYPSQKNETDSMRHAHPVQSSERGTSTYG